MQTVQHVCGRKQRSSRTMRERILNLPRTVSVVQHDDYGTGRVGSEDRGDRICTALHEDCHSIAGPDAFGIQSDSDGCSAAAEGTEVDLLIAIADGVAAAIPIGNPPQDGS